MLFVLIACGSWPERENVYANRLSSIQEKYKGVMQLEKQEKSDKERKKHLQRAKYFTLTVSFTFLLSTF